MSTSRRGLCQPALLASACILAAAACSAPGGDGAGTRTGEPVGAPVRAPEVFHVGREATAEEIAAWDLDVNPKGEGLPPGEGTVAQGAAVYAARCASCHGAAGEGIAPNPRLVGRIPGDSFPFAMDRTAPRTIGSYWPYASTLFDYIRRAMPQNALGSLSANEIYAVSAWLLSANGIIASDAVMNATTLPAVRMPSRDRFVPDDRTGGTGFR
jgi:S-disulfanyl-L-cysteine oxidoreductase SoxD